MSNIERGLPVAGSVPPRGDRLRETVSVVVTAWQRRHLVGEALDSVKFPDGLPVELVVVADFADDALAREVQKRRGKWIVSRNWRLGAMAADGVRAAQGSLIAFLDDDDLFHPLRLEEVRRAFEEDVELGFFHNAHVVFRDDNQPSFSPALPASDLIRIPPGHRRQSDCEFIWTQGAGFNGSSIAVRRALLQPYLDELSKIRKAVPPYLFYRAWCSPLALAMDARPLTGVRIHAANMTPNRTQGRWHRFARLASIGADLSADAETILEFVPPDVWSIPLRQMSSMGKILGVMNNVDGSSRTLVVASLELLRRRKTWLPRWTLVSLALLRLSSRSGARALFKWLTSRG